MPYSFTQIEEDKTKTIGFVFTFLILIYFVTFWLIAALFKSYFLSQSNSYQFSGLNLSQSLITLGFAMIIGYVHWSYTTANLIIKILGVLKAEKLSPNDTYHQMYGNIVEEVSIATGGRKMEPVVVPTMAMNAFALADFKGRAVIGVTEGVLARLTRAQIEAIVGHEAAHIMTGDCLSTTVTSSLFELFSGLLKGFEAIFKGNQRGYSSTRVRGGSGGGAILFLILVYSLLCFTKFLSQIVRLFISRQREYRADAIAVRLTRDPLSLAEALYAISHRWRGAGLPAQELEAIFTVNPVHSVLDEKESLWAEMFSTHPPIKERLSVLLDMAHTDINTMMKDANSKLNKPRIQVSESQAAPAQWVVHKDGAWQGPYDLMKLATFGWIVPETWVQRIGTKDVKMAYEDADVTRVVSKTEGKRPDGAYGCPKCQITLNLAHYEGTQVYQCNFCKGTLVEERDIQRILIRQEAGFSDRIKKIAEGIKKEDQVGGFKMINRDPKTLFTCPKCQHVKAKMLRMFYTEAYRIEVDKCFACGLVWFDKDELEVLQYSIETAVEKV